MEQRKLDDVDRAILRGLFHNARRESNGDIADRAGVTQSTVSKRIRQLEEDGIIEGYKPLINYEAAGFPIRVLFICTAPISLRDQYIQEAKELDNVVEVRELMVGGGNVHITVVGEHNDDITRIAKRVDEIGFEVGEEILMRGTIYCLPASIQER